jgi:serine phosphatase RsbU (regulator of sigma subunit)
LIQDLHKFEQQLRSLIDELENFEEISKYLKPLPGEIPHVKNMDIYGDTISLKSIIGGDHIVYVDFNKRYDLDALIKDVKKHGRNDIAERLEKNRKKAGIMLADVSGHRITDALLTGMLHQAFLLGVIYELKYMGTVTVDLFENINTRFYNSSAVGKYITMIYGEISETGSFHFISAGHPPPIVFSYDFNKIVEISGDRLTTFPPIATMPSKEQLHIEFHDNLLGYKEKYTINELNLMGKGDIMILYSDGFSEHADESGEEYFKTRLENKLRELKDSTSKNIFLTIRDDLLGFAAPADDLSFIVIKRT